MTSKHVTRVNDANFESEVLDADKLVLIGFYADWCGPCKTMAPRVDDFAAENPDVKVVKINVDESPKLAAAFSIKSIPTLVTMINGAAVYGVVGAKSGIEKLVADSVKSLNILPDNKLPHQPPHDNIGWF